VKDSNIRNKVFEPFLEVLEETIFPPKASFINQINAFFLKKEGYWVNKPELKI